MLKYVGGGSLIGVPARNLTDDEAFAYGGREKLIASGLYVEVQPEQKAEQPPAENKAVTPAAENKKPGARISLRSGTISARGGDATSDNKE